MKRLACCFTLLLCGFLGSSTALSQAILRGLVTDSVESQPLPGANITLLGTALGGSTNLEGEYSIMRIPAGTYTVRVSYVGYKSKQIPVRLENDQVRVLNVRLISDLIEGSEVVVTAQMRGQVAAINQQLSSNTIINVVSEEKIQELPDANAAEAIGRLPGVSLLRSGGEASKVILRGMRDKFTSITIDGFRIPSTDADERGVDLSTVSQGSLAGIELYKALTPDMDADAIAGAVNLVTKKAPLSPLIRLDAKGQYGKLDNTLSQYDFSARYGQRFVDNTLGLQFTGNLERRNRSNEEIDIDYNLNRDGRGTDYEITDFSPNYTNEIRTRQGLGGWIDYDTPDSGSVILSAVYNQTKRDFIAYNRNYPTDGRDLVYTARDREQEIGTLLSSLRGENYLLGLKAIWGISFAQSRAEYPYDYAMDFREPASLDGNGNVVSRMLPVPTTVLKGPPELLIPYALNNFDIAYLNWGYYRGEKNLDKERTAFLDISRDYILGQSLAGTIKLGGKYRHKERFKEASELASPYYLDPFREWSVMPDGSVQRKRTALFPGTRFANLSTVSGRILLSNFLDIPDPARRNVFDRYDLYPLINRDALREWYDLNKNGVVDSLGRNPEYKRDNEVDADYYDIDERVAAGYVMNTLNIGPDITFIAGLRVEQENNDYYSRYSPGPLTGFPTPTGQVIDTSATHRETNWLPNFQMTVRPLDFMSVRLAAYRALARPDFNRRLNKYVARNSAGSVTLYVGNPDLQAAKAWNYEANTSFFSNTIGLITVSAFYKDIKDMYHIVDGAQTRGQTLLDSLGIPWKAPFDPGVAYDLTYPLNSSRPTKVWGFELEHQANLSFLPGLLSNIILSYNVSLVRSETYVISSRLDTTYVETIIPGFPPIRRPVYTTVLYDSKQKLEGQPELFGNFAVGYDIGGFSGRISFFYQSSYDSAFSVDGRNDPQVNSFSRWDISIRQRITENFSLLLNVNNLTDIEEGTSIHNRIVNWDLLNTSQKYGLSASLGARLEF